MQDLKISKRKTLRSQISDYLRDSILRGEIEAGSRLPSTTALAERWGTQTANVHAALSLLVQEGLLTRKNGVGTIVNKRKEELNSILIYLSQNITLPSENFYRQLHICIKDELDKRGIQQKVIYKSYDHDHFSDVMELTGKGLVQGLISMSIDKDEREKLKKLPVPFSCVTTARIPNRVSLSFNSLIEKVCEGFALQGCKKAGLLLATEAEDINESGAIERRNFIENLQKMLKENGIEVRPEWVCTPANNNNDIRLNPDQFAYDGFNHIWSSEEKPEGIFVYTDALISGTLISILSNRVMVPEDLKLVLHRNSECKVLCPLPCVFIENNVKEMATGLVQLIIDQYHGKEVKQIDFEYKLIDNT